MTVPRAQGVESAAEHVGAECTCNTGWCVMEHLYDRGGVGVLCFLLVAYTFYKLVWKVWQAAMNSRDEEIERLINERNYLQSKLFPDRTSASGEQDD